MEGSRFLINNVPFYFKGFGKRQDSDVSPLFLCVNTLMMQRTANENAAGLRRICKGPDEPKIESLET